MTKDNTRFQSSAKPVDMPVPPLNSILSYKGVWLLCSVVRTPEWRLRATHYAACLLAGQRPIWGVWTIHGNFVRFFGRKSEVVDGYPAHVWRHKQATWGIVDVHDKDESERRNELAAVYHKHDRLSGDELQKLKR